MEGMRELVAHIHHPRGIELFTRPVAFVLSGQMAVAYFWIHVPNGLFPWANRGELAAIYSFVFLFLAAAGGGNFSIDNIMAKKKAES